MARNTSVVEVSFTWLPATFCMFSTEPQEIERFKVRDGWKVWFFILACATQSGKLASARVYTLHVIPSLLRHCGTGPDKRLCCPSCPVSRWRHRQNMQRTWTQAPANCKATMRDCRRVLLSFCFDIDLCGISDCFKGSNVEVANDLLLIFNMWILVQHCMKERLEYLEGKLGDSADKHSKAASGCAVLNVATIMWSLMLPISAPACIPQARNVTRSWAPWKQRCKNCQGHKTWQNVWTEAHTQILDLIR